MAFDHVLIGFQLSSSCLPMALNTLPTVFHSPSPAPLSDLQSNPDAMLNSEHLLFSKCLSMASNTLPIAFHHSVCPSF